MRMANMEIGPPADVFVPEFIKNEVKGGGGRGGGGGGGGGRGRRELG